MKATLVLENGRSFEGVSIGAPAERIGEVILNTAVVGYQEMMTDPANAGKLLALTYPLIGNYGVANKFYESRKCWVNGLIMKECSRIYSNWQAEGSFQDFLNHEGVVALSEVDTRTLAVELRNHGEMMGIITSEPLDGQKAIKKLREHKKKGKNNFISNISVKAITEVETGSRGPRVAVLDLGMLKSFTAQLKSLKCGVALLPYNITPKEILAIKPDGLVISSGPEDDAAIPEIIKTVNGVLGKIPILGISLGHELIALALGGKVKKMKLGHRGVNYPVKPADSFKGEITTQNHSYIVDEDSIRRKKAVEITLRNINDGSIEEMESKSLKFISTQYYPVSPGFGEVNNVFLRFLKLLNPSGRAGIKTKKNKQLEVSYAKT
ncbi:MAG: glutamine-hydrolyzing carbamoyl-phosphate synthase small subunit [Candidatus Omnitrophica bacterium]|nr:glutamine-hydrolyzing carbamoyl-phosphate synthase small subunit [Candidatus Omnitrophota bacterium]